MKAIRKVEVILRYAIWALKESFKPNQMYYAMYKGIRCTMHNELFDEDIWTLSSDVYGVFRNIHTDEFKVCISIRNWFIVYKQKFKFLMSCWYLIDTSRTVGTRQCYLSSSNIKF